MAENPPKLPPKLIDAGAHRRYRARASAGFAGVNYIKMAAVERVVDRLEGMKGGFALALDVGAHHGELGRAAIASGKIAKMVSLEPAPPMAAVIPRTLNPLVMDYDGAQFFPNVFDAVVSAFALHWVDDLAGLLVRMRGWLRADGLLLVALAGGASFAGLRACLTEAESRVVKGLSPRVLPMGDVRDLGALLGRAGFALPVADRDCITITWQDPMAMMRELRLMGEGNALAGRVKHFTRREILLEAAALYQQRFGTSDGRVSAEIELITLTAWAPAPHQQQPLKRGSATHHLGDFL